MPTRPVLSIVTPTLGKFTEHWLEQLLAIKGAAEFVLVYPPGAKVEEIDDPRVTIVYSMFKGETPQRMCGLLNAAGEYVIALDDDDLLHPDVVDLTIKYFHKFPESWILRLRMSKINVDAPEVQAPWQPIAELDNLTIAAKRSKDDLTILQEVPIVPFNKSVDLGVVLWPYKKRKDHHGPHMENFNNRIWKTALVKEALTDLSETMKIADPWTWVPFWGLDRLLSVYIQAKFYQPDLVIGHWMPEPEQIRYLLKPQELRKDRYYIQAEGLAFRRFPQYGYLWNFFFDEFYNSVKTKIRSILGIQKPYLGERN
jgi:glycosyltransferase involved in cell wall biosynthesis